MMERPSFDLMIIALDFMKAVLNFMIAFGALILETENLKARHENGL